MAVENLREGTTGDVSPTPPPAAPPTWPPGWYDVTGRSNTQGYWDGTRWTGDFAPKPRPAATAAPKTGLVIGLAGFAALAVGSIGPWADALFISVSGTRGDGKLTLIAAGFGAFTLLLGRGGAVLAALVGLAGLGVSVYDIIHISQKASEVTFAGVQVAQVGWGLYVAAGGATIAVVGALIHRKNIPPV